MALSQRKDTPPGPSLAQGTRKGRLVTGGGELEGGGWEGGARPWEAVLVWEGRGFVVTAHPEESWAGS